MAEFTVPPAASSWIAARLKLPDWKKVALEEEGLTRLTVSELKDVWGSLLPLTTKRMARKHVPKNALCGFIQSLFYMDAPVCQVCDQAMLQLLLQQQQVPPTNHPEGVKPAAASLTLPSSVPKIAAVATAGSTPLTNVIPAQTPLGNATSTTTVTTSTAATLNATADASMAMAAYYQNIQAQTRAILAAATDNTTMRQPQQQPPSAATPRVSTTGPQSYVPQHSVTAHKVSGGMPPPRNQRPPSTRVHTLHDQTFSYTFSTAANMPQPSIATTTTIAAASATADAIRRQRFPVSPDSNKKRKHSVVTTVMRSSDGTITTMTLPSMLVKRDHEGATVAQQPLAQQQQPPPQPQQQQASLPPPPQQSAAVSENQPNNPREAQLAAELAQMGFTDTTEVLNGIRTLLARQHPPSTEPAATNGEPSTTATEAAPTPNTNNIVTADEVMIWLIEQREEQEEARKIDEVRLHSEMLRKDAADRRQQETQRQFMEASWTEWLASERMFAHSWLLRNTTLQTTWWQHLSQQRGLNKQALIDLLMVEKQARQWYGNVLPYCYFHYTVCQRFVGIHSSKTLAKVPFHLMVPAMQEQVHVLKTGMFTLSEQQGGVPRIFLNAEQEAIRKGLPTSGDDDTNVSSLTGHCALNADDDDDDDVVEIVDQPRSTVKANNRAPLQDVIEIT